MAPKRKATAAADAGGGSGAGLKCALSDESEMCEGPILQCAHALVRMPTVGALCQLHCKRTCREHSAAAAAANVDGGGGGGGGGSGGGPPKKKAKETEPAAAAAEAAAATKPKGGKKGKKAKAEEPASAAAAAPAFESRFAELQKLCKKKMTWGGFSAVGFDTAAATAYAKDATDDKTNGIDWDTYGKLLELHQQSRVAPGTGKLDPLALKYDFSKHPQFTELLFSAPGQFIVRDALTVDGTEKAGVSAQSVFQWLLVTHLSYFDTHFTDKESNWLAVRGAAGTGKTRFAYECCVELSKLYLNRLHATYINASDQAPMHYKSVESGRLELVRLLIESFGCEQKNIDLYDRNMDQLVTLLKRMRAADPVSVPGGLRTIWLIVVDDFHKNTEYALNVVRAAKHWNFQGEMKREAIFIFPILVGLHVGVPPSLSGDWTCRDVVIPLMPKDRDAVFLGLAIDGALGNKMSDVKALEKLGEEYNPQLRQLCTHLSGWPRGFALLCAALQLTAPDHPTQSVVQRAVNQQPLTGPAKQVLTDYLESQLSKYSTLNVDVKNNKEAYNAVLILAASGVKVDPSTFELTSDKKVNDFVSHGLFTLHVNGNGKPSSEARVEMPMYIWRTLNSSLALFTVPAVVTMPFWDDNWARLEEMAMFSMLCRFRGLALKADVKAGDVLAVTIGEIRPTALAKTATLSTLLRIPYVVWSATSVHTLRDWVLMFFRDEDDRSAKQNPGTTKTVAATIAKPYHSITDVKKVYLDGGSHTDMSGGAIARTATNNPLSDGVLLQLVLAPQFFYFSQSKKMMYHNPRTGKATTGGLPTDVIRYSGKILPEIQTKELALGRQISCFIEFVSDRTLAVKNRVAWCAADKPADEKRGMPANCLVIDAENFVTALGPLFGGMFLASQTGCKCGALSAAAGAGVARCGDACTCEVCDHTCICKGVNCGRSSSDE